MDELQKAAQIAVEDCMGVKGNETVLVITDAERRKIGYALFEVSCKLANESIFLEMQAREVNGEEPPSQVAEVMRQVDIVLCPTSKSLTHTDARREACRAGARVGTLPGITEDMMIRTMGADYSRIAELTFRLSEILDGGQLAYLTTSLGTDIKIPIAGIKAISSTGLIREKGAFGNLPSGESYLMPEEGKSNGVFVVDGSMAGLGKITGDPVKIKIKDGYATEITGGSQAQKLTEMIESVGPQARNLAELGIGTNYMAQITGHILEDEKVAGTVHLALGNNKSMGGTVNVGFHVDGIMTRPSLQIDDVLILDEGKLMVT